MNRDNLKNNLNEQENLSADERKISNLIGGLEKVSAPKDFDFRLKARISAAKENNFQPSMWQTLRYVLPVSATAIIAAFVMIQAGLFSGDAIPQENNFASANQVQPQNTGSEGLPFNQEVVQTTNSNIVTETPSVIEKTEITRVADDKLVSEKQKQIPVKYQPKSTPKGEPRNSRDLAQSPPSINILPEGISGNTSQVNKELNQNNSVSAQEILNFIGVETENEGNKLRVKSVKENSLAGRSGVRTGDIVEAIDEQRLDQQNLSPNFKGGKTITVTRDNKVLEIELKPN